MLEYLRKRQGEAKAQETEKEQAAVPAGAGNQAMLSMLEAQGERGEDRPASGGTPLAEAMRAKFERHFGLPMDDVRVHRNSDEPAKFDAGAYTYCTDIFIGPGQEDLLNHEMTHVAQQKLGQVRPTGMEHGMAVNRSPALEHSADLGTVSQAAGSAAGPVVQCGGDGDIEQASQASKGRKRQASRASKGRKRQAPSPTDVEPAPKKPRTSYIVAELKDDGSGLIMSDPLRMGTKGGETLRKLTTSDLAFCFRSFATTKSSSEAEVAALFDAGIAERFQEKKKHYERNKDGDTRCSTVKSLSKRIVRAQGRELYRHLTNTRKLRPTSRFGDKVISADSEFVMPLLFKSESPDCIVVRAASSFWGNISRSHRFLHQGKQPFLTTSPAIGTKYDTIIDILNRLSEERKKEIFGAILNYLSADTKPLEPLECKGTLTDEQRRAANTLAALLVVESHYSRALSDGGKFARAAVRFCKENPDKLNDVFGSKGAFTMSRDAGGETTDVLLTKRRLELFERHGNKKKTVRTSEELEKVKKTLEDLAKEMSDSSDEEGATSQSKPRQRKSRKKRITGRAPDPGQPL